MDVAVRRANAGDVDEVAIGKFLLHATDDGRPLYESSGFAANANWLERHAAV